MRYLISLALIGLFGCEGSPRGLEVIENFVNPPEPISEIQPVPFEIIPVYVPDPPKIVKPKPSLPEFRRGKAILELAEIPTLREGKEELSAVRDLVLHYGGKDWNPWFGVWKSQQGYILVVNKIHWEAAHPFCHWMSWIGWGWYEGTDGTVSRLMSGSPRSKRMCRWNPDCYGLEGCWGLRPKSEKMELGVDKLTGEHRSPRKWGCSYGSYGPIPWHYHQNCVYGPNGFRYP